MTFYRQVSVCREAVLLSGQLVPGFHIDDYGVMTSTRTCPRKTEERPGIECLGRSRIRLKSPQAQCPDFTRHILRSRPRTVMSLGRFLRDAFLEEHLNLSIESVFVHHTDM